jgi:hypothetical protein
MVYPEPYEPSEEEIQAIKDKLKQKHLHAKLKETTKASKKYSHGVTFVPRDTRPVVGTNYQ